MKNTKTLARIKGSKNDRILKEPSNTEIQSKTTTNKNPTSRRTRRREKQTCKIKLPPVNSKYT